MESWQLELLACPFDHEALMEEGEDLICSACGRSFPITDGIPRFVVPDLTQVHNQHEWQWKQSEMKARNEQAVFYDRLFGLRLLTPFEVPMTIKGLLGDRQYFGTLAEIGCGTGRMLQHFADYADFIVGVDLSLESLRRCCERMQRLGVTKRALIVHADASFLPFRGASFDAIVSCQMIEHVPSDRTRRLVITEITRILKPNGRYAISGYQWSWFAKLAGPKEGMHKGGIYYYRFTREEFVQLIGEHLTVESLRTIFGYAWLASGSKQSSVTDD